jgi:hypothetical protein
VLPRRREQAIGELVDEVHGHIIAGTFNELADRGAYDAFADRFPMTVTNTVQPHAAAAIPGTSTTTRLGMCSLQAHGGRYGIRFDWHVA